MKTLKWIKKNWYYLLIVPAVFVAVAYLFRLSAAMITGSDKIAGNPDTTEVDREIIDIGKEVDKKHKEKEEKIKDEHNKNLKELKDGKKTPSDIFNEEIGGGND